MNNLAIRSATEEWKVTGDYDQVRWVLVAAFDSNDFDSFDLKLQLLPGELSSVGSEPQTARRNGFFFR